MKRIFRLLDENQNFLNYLSETNANKDDTLNVPLRATYIG